MTNEDLLSRLELAYGCMIGSHTDNYTPQQQFKSIIKELKQGQTLPIHGVTLNEVALCDCFRKEKTNMLTGMYCKKHKIFFSMEHNEG